MPWDETAAREAVVAFHQKFTDLKRRHPEAVAELEKLWRDSFPKCGHKRLGRIVLGKSVDEACRTRGE